MQSNLNRTFFILSNFALANLKFARSLTYWYNEDNTAFEICVFIF